MRVLTVRQPWAHLIAYGGKTVENRSRRTKYVGPIAVHAAKTLPIAEWEWARRHFGAKTIPDTGNLVLGAVVAVADLAGCHAAGWPSRCTSEACRTWGEDGGDTWHWVLARVQPLAEPIPARGQLGLWNPNDELAAAISAAERQ